MLENKTAYKHDFDGSCAPKNQEYTTMQTFSVGIFQWMPKASGKGLKRSPVKYRLRGYRSNAEMVYMYAREMCRKMDGGWTPDKKSLFVK